VISDVHDNIAPIHREAEWNEPVAYIPVRYPSHIPKHDTSNTKGFTRATALLKISYMREKARDRRG
jgi:hypothetical protein